MIQKEFSILFMSILNRDFKILDKTLLFIDNNYKLLEYIMRANNVDSISVKQKCLTEILIS